MADKSPSEPSTQDPPREPSNRFDNHETTTRAHINSLKRSLRAQMDTTISHHFAQQEEHNRRFSAAMNDLFRAIQIQPREIRRLKEMVLGTDARKSALRADVRLLRRIIDNGLSRQNPHAFPQFQRLPSELRCMIWDWATPGKILELRAAHREIVTSDAPSIQLVGNYSPPVTAQVCRESRAVACRGGELVSLGDVWICTFRDPFAVSLASERQWVWFDSSRDSLYFRNIDIPFSKFPLLSKVRHVFFDAFRCETNLCQLLQQEHCPQLESIGLVCGPVIWPIGANVWGNEHYHIPIQVIDGDVPWGKRPVEDLRKRLGPHSRVRTSLSLDYAIDLAVAAVPQFPWEDLPEQLRRDGLI
jgi:hypothetical protein